MYEFKDSDGDIITTGYKLKFYYEEHEAYWKEYSLTLTQHQAQVICRKLCRHFKVRVSLYFWGRSGGRYSRWERVSTTGMIFLPHDKASVGILCHEMAHAIHHQRYHKRGHTKQLRRIMDRVMAYAKKKNYWVEQRPISIFDFLERDYSLSSSIS